MLRIFFVGAAIIAVFVFAKRDHWLERAGVLGSCQLVRTPYRETGQWWSCREGMVSGYPVLTGQQCDSQGVVAARELWKCQKPLSSVPSAF